MKASLSHRRESLWERLIASRPDNPITGRQEVNNFPMNSSNQNIFVFYRQYRSMSMNYNLY
jgi:hypothetical protein